MAVRIRMYQDGAEFCDRCGDAGRAALPDVYWDGTAEHGLADDPRTGQPRVFASKGEKARYLRERGLVEGGDKIHGATPFSTGSGPRENPRDVAMKALHHVKQMGRDQKRKEILRILKEANRG